MHSAATMTRKGRPNKKRKTRKLVTAQRPPRSRRQWALFLLKWGAIGGLAMSAIFMATVATLFWIYGRDPALPKISKLSDYDPPKVSRVITADGAVIGEIFTQRRTMVAFDDIPEVVIHAFVAAEDANFFSHKGIDYYGMVRALFVNLKSGKAKQGASTITQQVVKNLLLSREKTFKRKIQEIILARRLESSLSKQEILTLYANEIFFGHGRYGIEEAARYYFGKHVGELNVGEAALLAGLPKGPNRYSPKRKKNHERAKTRQIYVLEQMHANGYISAEVAQKFIDEPIQVIADPYPTLGQAPEWVELARLELIETVGTDAMNRAGVDIVVSVDLEVQELARVALQNALRAVDQRQKHGYPIKTIKPDKIDLEVAKLARKLPDAGPKVGKTYRAVVRRVDDANKEMLVDLGDWKASVLLGGSGDARYNPDGKPPSERFKPGHIVKIVVPKARPQNTDEDGDDEARAPTMSERVVDLSKGPEGALVVIDPKTRQVLAVVGGYDSRVAGFNRAVQAKRQAGSTFKPFVYAAALDTGEYTPATVINDAPEVYDLWKPENYKKGKFEGPVRMRYALAKSINTVAIRVAHDVTPQSVANMARDMGVRSKLPDGLAIALGAGEVTPLELTNAFATFAAGGKVARPRVVARVGDDEVGDPGTSQALRPEVAYVSTHMMRSVVDEGTAGRARKLKMHIAGKTGTTNDTRDAWFVGFSPSLVVGVWVGHDNFRQSLGRGESGGKTALPAFVEVMGKLGKRSDRFKRPSKVVEARIDEASGKLAAEGVEEGAYSEVFVEGTVPIEVAAAPGQIDVGDLLDDQFGDAPDEPKEDEEKKDEATP